MSFEAVNGGTAYSVGLSGYSNEITDIIIPDTYNGLPVTKIKVGGFKLSNITSIRIPSSINYIGAEAFFAATKLMAVYIDDITAWCKVVFESNASNPLATYGTLFVKGKQVDILEIPDEVMSISGRSFRGCDEIKSLVIGKNLSSVGSYAFYGCDNLSEVYYKGTPSEWSSILINGSGNDALVGAKVYYYSERDPFEEETGGNFVYWHYVDGMPEIWMK